MKMDKEEQMILESFSISTLKYLLVLKKSKVSIEKIIECIREGWKYLDKHSDLDEFELFLDYEMKLLEIQRLKMDKGRSNE